MRPASLLALPLVVLFACSDAPTDPNGAPPPDGMSRVSIYARSFCNTDLGGLRFTLTQLPSGADVAGDTLLEGGSRHYLVESGFDYRLRIADLRDSLLQTMEIGGATREHTIIWQCH